MSLRGSFGVLFLFIVSYGQKKWDENDRKIATSTQKAPTARLMENLGLSGSCWDFFEQDVAPMTAPHPAHLAKLL